MPSPFPGMDPYLEVPHLWPDFHEAIAGDIRRDLNRTLPRPYYAQMGMRPEVGILGEETRGRIIPDIAVVRRPRTPTGTDASSVAVLDQPRTDVTPSVRMRVFSEPLRHHFVEIRDAAQAHALVTLIEIVSPSNKRHGPDRQAYEAEQQAILKSDTSLVEIDLLRSGEPIIGGPQVIEAAGRLTPRPDYLVGVSRAWERGGNLEYELFPIGLEEPLPCIGVPLREGEPDVPLDLQYVFNLAYDGGPYARGAVDYGSPPDPPLGPDLAGWLSERLDRWRGGATG